jgi:uncharacterized protein (TIGR02757 family)
MQKISESKIGETLNELYGSYLSEFKQSPSNFFKNRKDPISFAHRYKEFHDQEAAAFLAATFAYGNVTSLCAFVDSLLALMGASPYRFLRKGEDAVASLAHYAPYYRLQKADDILRLLSMMSDVYIQHGSLYEIFLRSYTACNTMYVAASRFIEKLYQIHGSPIPFLLPSPSGGSPCKRLNLFFRWMVRRDGLDVGIWEKVSPSYLIMPLDTHIGRIAYAFGWIKTPSLSWKKAEAITATLRQFDSDDPTRFDFSLCHESISRNPWLRQLIEKHSQK